MSNTLAPPQERAPATARARVAGRARGASALVLLTAGLLVAIVFATANGAVAIPPGHVAGILWNLLGIFPVRPTWAPTDALIILDLRLPEVIGAALVGAALAVAGALFQGLFRNPLAEPYVIGASAGASLGATIGLLLPLTLSFLGFGQVALLAFIGALGAVALAYWLARTGGRTPIVTLLLAGVIITAVSGAIQTLLFTVTRRLASQLAAIFVWMVGGVSVQTWTQVTIVAILIGVGLILALGFAPVLDALALGDEGAAYLGVNVELQKLLLVVVGSLLTAAAVAISGLIGFVGLMVPHAVRLVLGPRHRLLLPAAALGGALFLVVADLLARIILAPSVLPVGILTALSGGPFFLFLLHRTQRNYRW
jgi:iron complex transport system permease protein